MAEKCKNRRCAITIVLESGFCERCETYIVAQNRANPTNTKRKVTCDKCDTLALLQFNLCERCQNVCSCYDCYNDSAFKGLCFPCINEITVLNSKNPSNTTHFFSCRRCNSVELLERNYCHICYNDLMDLF